MKFQRSSGILLHPTSFPSPFGIGDFGPGAYEFIDFLEQAGQSLWQVLPLGPTSFGDSPYQSFSTFAGNTLLLSPLLLKEEGYLNQDDLNLYPSFSSTEVNYDGVFHEKNKLYKKAFQKFQNSGTPEQKKNFSLFIETNKSWLTDYTLFMALKNHFIQERKNTFHSKELEAFQLAAGPTMDENLKLDYFYGAVWSTWPEDLIHRTPTALNQWSQKLSDEIDFHAFLQYEFFRQWAKLKKYANEKNIQIIGDIPIFVAYDSADVWACPENYHIDEKGFPVLVAGVPPDYFSATGQLWGNPSYQWEAHEKNHFQWWIARIKSMLKIVDILRIDHFRGFESAWGIPFGAKDATGGSWKKGPGEKLFFAIINALGELPLIAEDLGIITAEVTALRNQFSFPGMKVLHFAFDGSSQNAYLPHNYTQNAVVYTGTHDNDTTRGWYEKAPESERDAFRRYCNADGNDPAWQLMRLAWSSVADFAICPFQDVLNLNSQWRMNTPSVAAGNWKFRYTSDMLKNEYMQGLRYVTELFGRLPVKEEIKEEPIQTIPAEVKLKSKGPRKHPKRSK